MNVECPVISVEIDWEKSPRAKFYRAIKWLFILLWLTFIGVTTRYVHLRRTGRLLVCDGNEVQRVQPTTKSYATYRLQDRLKSGVWVLLWKCEQSVAASLQALRLRASINGSVFGNFADKNAKYEGKFSANQWEQMKAHVVVPEIPTLEGWSGSYKIDDQGGGFLTCFRFTAKVHAADWIRFREIALRKYGNTYLDCDSVSYPEDGSIKFSLGHIDQFLKGGYRELVIRPNGIERLKDCWLGTEQGTRITYKFDGTTLRYNYRDWAN